VIVADLIDWAILNFNHFSADGLFQDLNEVDRKGGGVVCVGSVEGNSDEA
jgi:hypothetical protein